MKTLHWSHAKRFCNEPITKRSPSSRPLLSIVHSSGFLSCLCLCLVFLLFFFSSSFPVPLFSFFFSSLLISSRTAVLRVCFHSSKDPVLYSFVAFLFLLNPLPVRGCDALIIISLLPLRSFELPEYFPSTTILSFRQSRLLSKKM